MKRLLVRSVIYRSCGVCEGGVGVVRELKEDETDLVEIVKGEMGAETIDELTVNGDEEGWSDDDGLMILIDDGDVVWDIIEVEP
jgi:hypothetical protein